MTAAWLCHILWVFIAITLSYIYRLAVQPIHTKRKASFKIHCILKHLIYHPFSCLQCDKIKINFSVMLHALATASTQTFKPETLPRDCPRWGWLVNLNNSFISTLNSSYSFLYMLANGGCSDLVVSRHLHNDHNAITGYIRWFLYCHFLIPNRRMELLAMPTQKAHKIIKLRVFQCDQ